MFQVQELTRSVRVNAQGLITLPLLGQVQAGGLTANELETALAAKLSENLLQDPQVSVFVKEFVSQRVVVDGSVMRIGAYPLTGKTALLQVVAMAGGLDPLADPSTVHILRDKPSGEREIFTYNLLAIRDGEVADPLIKGNDTVTVEKIGCQGFFQGRDRYPARFHQLWPVYDRPVVFSLLPGSFRLAFFDFYRTSP